MGDGKPITLKDIEENGEESVNTLQDLDENNLPKKDDEQSDGTNNPPADPNDGSGDKPANEHKGEGENENEDAEQEEKERETQQRVDDLFAKGESDPKSLTEDEITFLQENGVEIVSTPTNPFEGVQELLGTTFDVDYGDTDPSSPQGKVKYLDAYKQQAIQEWEEEVKKVAPRAYQAMLLENQGGNPAEYFLPKDNDTTDYNSVKITEEDTNTSKTTIRKSLLEKGLDENSINDLIDVYSDKGVLTSEGEKALDHLQGLQKTREEDAKAEVKRIKEQEDNDINSFISNIDKEISTGIVGNFNLPKSEADAFNSYVQDNISYSNGKFYTTKEIDKDKLQSHLGSMFFEFKGGDLDSLVKSKVKSENVRRLVLAAEQSKGVSGKRDSGGKKVLKLGDI